MPTTSGRVSDFTVASFTVKGSFGLEVDGYADGVSINLAPQGDINTVAKGNDGISVIARTPGTNWIATITIWEASDSNDALSRWLASGFTQGATFRDGNGRTVISTDKAIPRQYATVTKSAGVEGRAWDVHLISPTVFVGGLNDRPNP